MNLYKFNDQQEHFLNLAKTISEDVVKPNYMQCEKDKSISPEIIKKFAENGLFGIHIPQKFGGQQAGLLTLCLVIEEVSKVCAGVSLLLAASVLGSYPIVCFGSDEQKAQILPDIATGKKIAAFALTEANAGSDALNMQTEAVKQGEYYIINGCKQWVTNANIADFFIVIAKTDEAKGARGLSAFIVDRYADGVTVVDFNDKMGMNASGTCHILFEQVKVKKENLLYQEGRGTKIIAETLYYSRLGVGAQALGIAEGALNDASLFSVERMQFGKSISSFPAIRHILADMATEIEVSKAFLYTVAKSVDSGATRYSKYSSMVKLFCSNVAMRATIDAIQVLGGYGYMKEYEVEKRMRDAKITQIYEGTNQIQKNEIATQLFKELHWDVLDK